MKAVITACILMMGAIVTSCSKDESPDNNVVVAQGDPVNVTVTINQASSGNSRASTSTVGASEEETKITGNLVVFVFDATAGSLELLESTHTVAINGSLGIGTGSVAKTATSNPFEITTGDKYFYVFANADQALEDRKGSYISGSSYLRSLAPSGSTHEAFRENILKNLLDGQLSTPEEFLIGTLWEGKGDYTANKKTVNLPVIAGNSVEIDGLQVGRLVSKVAFPSSETFIKQFTDAMNIGGKFTGTWVKVDWRLVNQPDEMFLVGNWEGPIPGNMGSQVKTPFFNSDNLFWKLDGSFIDAKHKTDFKDIKFLYTFENTHGGTLSGGGANYPRKGNTTAVQFECQFAPPSSGTYNPITDGGTFWAEKEADGGYTFYNSSNKTANAVQYDGGMVYYLAYITDTNEHSDNEGSTKYTVLRNHQYNLTIASISSLGDNDDNPFNDPDDIPGNITPGPDYPIDPIEKDSPNIVIKIDVLNWNLINQSVEW